LHNHNLRRASQLQLRKDQTITELLAINTMINIKSHTKKKIKMNKNRVQRILGKVAEIIKRRKDRVKAES